MSVDSLLFTSSTMRVCVHWFSPLPAVAAKEKVSISYNSPHFEMFTFVFTLNISIASQFYSKNVKSGGFHV